MRAQCNHVHAAVLRAVSAIAGCDPADRQKPVLIVEAASSADWASVTFVGARHSLELRLEGEAAAVAAACARLAGRLGDHDIPVAGQIVADIAVALSSLENRDGNMVTQMLTVNLLTIID
jgi:hypothetical protein